MTPPVSVVLPVYNGESTLARAVCSLQKQTLQDFEVIIIDDGSTDRTPDVVKQLQEEDHRIRSIRLPHQGLVSALNAGLQEARGAYLARMDADDISLPGRLELQKDFLDKHPGTGLIACRVLFGGDRRRSGGYAFYVDWSNSLLSSEEISLNRFIESPLAHPSVMFRRELVEQLGGYRDGSFPEDYELWLRWLEKDVRIDKLPEPLLWWSDPPERLSRTDSRYAADRFYEIKTQYLYRWLQRCNIFHPEVWQMGAGRTARRRARLLEDLGIEVATYVDIDPRKIGHSIRGRPVIHRTDIPPPGSCFLLSYVGSRGSREDIRQFLESRGYRLGKDFLLVA